MIPSITIQQYTSNYSKQKFTSSLISHNLLLHCHRIVSNFICIRKNEKKKKRKENKEKKKTKLRNVCNKSEERHARVEKAGGRNAEEGKKKRGSWIPATESRLKFNPRRRGLRCLVSRDNNEFFLFVSSFSRAAMIHGGGSEVARRAVSKN